MAKSIKAQDALVQHLEALIEQVKSGDVREWNIDRDLLFDSNVSFDATGESYRLSVIFGRDDAHA